jgi:hypothetical protein
MRYLRLSVSILLLALLSASALGIVNYDSYWYWMWKPELMLPGTDVQDEYLTTNNGARAVSMTTYGAQNNQMHAYVVSEWRKPNEHWRAFAHRFNDFTAVGLQFADTATIEIPSGEDNYTNVCISVAGNASGGRKVAVFGDDEDAEVRARAGSLTERLWPDHDVVSRGSDDDDDDFSSAVVMEDAANACAVFPAGYESGEDDYEGLIARWTTDGGGSWDSDNYEYIVEPYVDGPYRLNPSICKGAGGALHLVIPGNSGDTIKDS